MNIDKVTKGMNALNVDCIMSFDRSDIFYFTHLNIEGILVVIENKVSILVNNLYYNYALEHKDNCNIILLENGFKDAENFLIENKIHQIGLDFKNISASQYETLKKNFILKDTNIIKQIRMIKEQNEINNIKRAALIARNAFTKVYPMIKIGMSEKELADELSYQMRKLGAEKEAFETIVASGINSAYPHHIPTDKKIEDGDFLMIDFGAVIDNYNSDCTYTFLIGKRDNEQREFFNALFYAQTFARESIVPNKTLANQIDKRSRDELAKFGLDKYFIHSCGHGVGLDVHELPYIDSKSDTLIVPNMVFTIEPGIYLPGKYGVRIEQTILVKDNDVEILGYAPFMEII